MRRAFFSLGSNLGDRRAHLAAGVAAVAAGEPARVSRVYVTEPVGGVAQPDFWNLVVEVRTEAPPAELLARARRAEEARGRQRTLRWGPRTLDVDVIWIDGYASDDPELTVPHPRAFERAFVLAPWRELAEDLVSPAARDAASGEVAVLGTLDDVE